MFEQFFAVFSCVIGKKRLYLQRKKKMTTKTNKLNH